MNRAQLSFSPHEAELFDGPAMEQLHSMPLPQLMGILDSTAAEGRLSKVQQLLDADLYGDSAVHAASALLKASRNGHFDVVELLIARGATMQGRTRDLPPQPVRVPSGIRPIEYLESGEARPQPREKQALSGKAFLESAMKELKDAGGQCGTLRSGLRQHLQSCLDDLETIQSHALHPERTVLTLAVLRGSYRLVEIVLSFGVDADQRELQGDRPLHLAARSGRVDLAQMLLRAQASKTLRDRAGRTASQHAQAQGFAELASLLR